jgi:Xaa-Pro dipeptidase
VVTIEPGVYFIPMLLDRLKQNDAHAKFVNWSLVDELLPCGGIRIEDDVLVTQDGYRNLTREFLPV